MRSYCRALTAPGLQPPGQWKGQHGPRESQDTAGSRKAPLGWSFCLQGVQRSFSWEVLFRLMSSGPDLMLLEVLPPPRSLL